MISALSYDKSLLSKLIALKAVTLVVSVSVIFAVFYFFDIEVSYRELVVTLTASSCVLLIWCVRLSFNFLVTQWEVFFLLISDIVVLYFLIEQSGGGSNPFTSSLLVPLALSAALLRKPFSLAIVVFSILIYANWTFDTDGSMHHMDHSKFSLHLYGMWINFVVSALILFVFVSYAMDSVRLREVQLQQAREKILRDEQLVAIATVTANTAHALGTPLSTLSILVEEWKQGGTLSIDEQKIFEEQLNLCKSHLAKIGKASTTETVDIETTVEEFFKVLREHYALLRPTEDLEFSFDSSLSDLHIVQSQGLLLAIENLVENAIESGGQSTRISFKKDRIDLLIEIEDSGKGLDASIKEELGQQIIRSEKGTWGLGVYLSNSTIEQKGGSITLENKCGNGTLTRIRLPLSKS